MADELVLAPICQINTNLIWELVQETIPECWDGMKRYMEQKKDVFDCAVRMALSIDQDPNWEFDFRFGDTPTTIYSGYPAVFTSESGWMMVRATGGNYIDDGKEIYGGSVEIHIGQDMFDRYNLNLEFLRNGRVISTIRTVNYHRSQFSYNSIGRLVIPKFIPEVMKGEADYLRIVRN